MNEENPAAPPERDLRAEYHAARRQCTPKQRKWLTVTYELSGQKWAACSRLGYSKRTVWEWLRQERVQKCLALQAEMAEHDHDITRARLLQEYSNIAFANIEDFRGLDGARKKFAEWSREMCAAVSEVEIDKDGYPTKVKLHRKSPALDSLAKIQGLLVEKHEIDLKNTPPPIVRIVRRAPEPG